MNDLKELSESKKIAEATINNKYICISKINKYYYLSECDCDMIVNQYFYNSKNIKTLYKTYKVNNTIEFTSKQEALEAYKNMIIDIALKNI